MSLPPPPDDDDDEENVYSNADDEASPPEIKIATSPPPPPPPEIKIATSPPPPPPPEIKIATSPPALLSDEETDYNHDNDEKFYNNNETPINEKYFSHGHEGFPLDDDAINNNNNKNNNNNNNNNNDDDIKQHDENNNNNNNPFTPLTPHDGSSGNDNLDKVGFTAILRQVDVGLEMLDLIKEVIRKYAKHQELCSAKLLEIYGKIPNNFIKMDGMKNFAELTDLTYKLILESVNAQKALSDYLANNIVPALTKDLQIRQQQVQQLKQNNRQAELKFKQSVANMESKSQLADAAAKRAKQVDYQSTNQRKLNKDKKKTGLKSFAKGLQKGIQKAVGDDSADLSEQEVLYKKAQEAAKTYEASVMTTNHEQNVYMKILERFKKDCIVSEQERITVSSEELKKFVDTHIAFFNNDKIKTLQTQIRSKLESLNENNKGKEKDIDEFLTITIQQKGIWKKPPDFEYKLPDFQNVFYSLEDAMKISKKQQENSNVNIKVPLILTSLCNKLESLNGFQTEGIFRISATQTDVDALREKLLKNEYDITTNDPHVCAGMLKEWLRGLNDSLIPQNYYDVCIVMAKDKEISTQKLEVFLSQLPEVNRETIRYIVKFLKKLLQPNNTNITKMNIENIAIVFGPTVLKCPHDDPQVLMVNSRYEKDFIIQLIEHL